MFAYRESFGSMTTEYGPVRDSGTVAFPSSPKGIGVLRSPIRRHPTPDIRKPRPSSTEERGSSRGILPSWEDATTTRSQ